MSEKRLSPKELEEFRQAKHKEVTNYIAARAFEAVPPEKRPRKDQAIGMRWILMTSTVFRALTFWKLWD